MLRRRHRRGHYAVASVDRSYGMRVLVRVVALAVLLYGLYFIGSSVLSFFGVGNSVRPTAIQLRAEERGLVSVSLEGDTFRPVEGDLKLYPDNTVTTGSNGHATLEFFDGTWMRMDENTTVTVTESTQGTEESLIAVEIKGGSVWVSTPLLASYSGAIVRRIEAPTMTFSLPSHSRAIVTPSSVAVFEADGLGVSIDVSKYDDTILIGEGQQLALPVGASVSGDPYAWRTALDPLAIRSPFAEESALMADQVRTTPGVTAEPGTSTGVTNSDIISLTSPADGSRVDGATVEVSGTVSSAVVFVRINGYQASIDEASRAFSRELTLPDQDEVSIHIEALGGNGDILEEMERTVTRDRKPPEKPTITSPAKDGEIYRINGDSIEIKGAPSPGAAGIQVNDYKLQLFQPGNPTWSYLASTRLSNLKQGINKFEVFSMNKAGVMSEPAVITIVVGEGPEGLITEDQLTDAEVESGETSSAPAAAATLPNNDPLSPGSLSVRTPEPGTSHATSEVEVVIEGATGTQTASVWINDYQLQLYVPGKTFWNYIASTKLNTMKRGANTYRIVTRNSAGEILDRLDYVITFTPAR